MYSPTTRVLTVLELLQSHDRMTARELASRIEVDPRTIRHYITALQDLGIPIEGERGRYGAYRLRPGFKLPPLMLSEDEAVAITLGLMGARAMGMPSAALAVEGALAKVGRVLPEHLRARVQAMERSITFHAETPKDAPEGDVLLALSHAAQHRQRVWLAYQRWDGEPSERCLDPYGIVQHRGRWYAAGHCHLRHELRVFRVDRIAAIRTLPDQFQRPPDIDILDVVLTSIAKTPGEWEAQVLLHTSFEQAREWLPASLALLEPAEDGVLMRCFAQDIDWLAHAVLSLPCPLQVLGPPALHQALATLARRAAQFGGSAPSGQGG